MPTEFKRFVKPDVSDVAEDSLYTVPVGGTATIIGLSLANKAGAATTGDARLDTQGGAPAGIAYIVKDTPIPANATLVAAGGDQKVVLQAGDIVQVKAASPNTLDAILSILEITP